MLQQQQHHHLGTSPAAAGAASRKGFPHSKAAHLAAHTSTSTSHRRGVVARTADLPLNGSTNSDEAADASKCPFLAQMRTPPMIEMPWLQRVGFQVFHPDKFQAFVLGQRGQDSMVQAPRQLAFTDFYMPATAELAKEVFAQEATGAITQGLAQEGGYTAFSTLLGKDNLLVVKDSLRHATLRALLQPAFSAEAIRTYLPAIQALVARHLGDWQAAGSEGVKAYPCLKMLTFDFILQIVMGREVPQPLLERLSNQFADLTIGLVAWPYLDLPFTPWRKALRARDELVGYFQAGITEARQQLAAGQQPGGVLGRLVGAEDEEGNRLTDAEISSNLLLVLLAGHDTSSTTLTRCLSNLQDNPWVLDKLRAEQQAVCAKHGDRITVAALKEMPFAEAVLRETLRRDPVVGAVMRVSTREFALGDYQVPASQTFLVPLRDLAEHDPRWEGKTGMLDPELFNPDRLMTPEGQKPGQLMPFGAGARYCLGAALALAEMKVFLALLARGYSFSADNNTEWKPALGFYPANGLPLVLTSRQ